MSEEFKREERYLVVKLSKLADDEGDNMSRSEQIFRIAHFGKALVNALVVEEDRPEHEPVWQMIERRMGGKPAVTAAEELEAVLHWRNKHAIAIKERDALQELLNQRDEANHDLEQRRHAEQQACQAAERRVEELEGLLNTALLAMKRIYQAGRDFIVGTGSDCDSVELMMENDPTAREIRAALNPTAEAASERAEDDRWLQMKDDAERAEYNDHEE